MAKLVGSVGVTVVLRSEGRYISAMFMTPGRQWQSDQGMDVLFLQSQLEVSLDISTVARMETFTHITLFPTTWTIPAHFTFVSFCYLVSAVFGTVIHF